MNLLIVHIFLKGMISVIAGASPAVILILKVILNLFQDQDDFQDPVGDGSKDLK